MSTRHTQLHRELITNSSPEKVLVGWGGPFRWWHVPLFTHRSRAHRPDTAVHTCWNVHVHESECKTNRKSRWGEDSEPDLLDIAETKRVLLLSPAGQEDPPSSTCSHTLIDVTLYSRAQWLQLLSVTFSPTAVAWCLKPSVSPQCKRPCCHLLIFLTVKHQTKQLKKCIFIW